MKDGLKTHSLLRPVQSHAGATRRGMTTCACRVASMTIVTEQDTKGAVRAGEEGRDRTKLTELVPGNSNECELQRRVDADHVARLYVAFEPPRVDSLNA